MLRTPAPLIGALGDTMNRLWQVPVGLGASLMADAALADTYFPTYEVHLSKRDTDAVTKAACSGTGRVNSIRAWTFEKGSSIIEMEVVCSPTQVIEGLPLAHRTTCDNKKGRWECADGYDAMVVRQDLTLIVEGVNGEKVLDLLPELPKVADAFGTPASTFVSGLCRVTMTTPFNAAERTTFDCYGERPQTGFSWGSRLAVTKDCAGSGCRIFVTEAER